MNKKRGMSIAAVLGVMVCLISVVTTVFVMVSRNSVLTSRSMSYIESYNEASTSIDNSINFMLDEANTASTVTLSFINDKCNAMTQLFGVDAQNTTSGENIDDTTNLKSTGFVVTIAKEYDGGTLYSIVSFSQGGSSGVITGDVLIDKETTTSLSGEDLLKEKYNSTNLLWDYWSYYLEQTGLSFDWENRKWIFPSIVRKESDNTLINTLALRMNAGTLLGYTSKLTSELRNWTDSVQSNVDENGNIISSKDQTAAFVKFVVNSAESSTLSHTFNDPDDLINPNWLESLGGSLLGTYNKTDVNNETIITISGNVMVNNAGSFGSAKNGKHIKLYVTNGSTLIFRGKLTDVNADIFVERGSSIIFFNDLEMEEYYVNNIAYAPTVDLDYTGGNYNNKYDTKVGGGLVINGSFKYITSDNALINGAYIKGAITASNQIYIQYNGTSAESTSESSFKLPVGITAYCDGECKFQNIGFYSTADTVRPFMLFANAEVSVRFCASYINGTLKPYNNGTPWANDDNVGFAIITCEKISGLERASIVYPIKMNIFYNDSKEMANDGDTQLIIEATNAWLKTEGVDATYNVYNGFISNRDVMHAAGTTVAEIEIAVLNWYIPPKLRGEMTLAAISATQVR